MTEPEAAQSEQTEIVQLRQQLAQLEARCQAVTAERDALRTRLKEQEDLAALYGEQAARQGEQVDALRATLGSLVEACKAAYDCLPSEAEAAKRQILDAVCPLATVTSDDIAWAQREATVLGAAPREGR